MIDGKLEESRKQWFSHVKNALTEEIRKMQEIHSEETSKLQDELRRANDKHSEEMKKLQESHSEDMRSLFERVNKVMDEGILLIHN